MRSVRAYRAVSNHALDAARPESAGHDDARCAVEQRVGSDALDLLRVHPIDLDVNAMGEACVAQRLAHRDVGVGQVGVLANDGDGQRALLLLHPADHAPPSRKVAVVGMQSELAHQQIAQARVLQDQRHLVDVVDGGEREDGVARDVAEHRQLVLDVVGDGLVGAADDGVGLDAERAQLLDGVLRRLGLELARGLDVGQQGDVDVEDVAAPHLAAHLADGLEEGLPLDVAYRAADLDDDDLGVGVLGEAEHELLDGVSDVRHGLDRPAQVVAAPLLADDLRVDLPSGHVRHPR